ncbi:MAG TPA: mannose-1-phosphate guanylyltransferase [Melioribacteraceae bacterium]|nr:mannose-1-phosphate guanylyltransferase [Melioribacteraceae bacterium]
MELYVCIMAGGVGSRFWPRSKQKTPKQLLKIFSNNSMIFDTVKRLNGLVENDKIYVVTNKIQKEKVEEELPFIPKENIIAEPYGKNTAACIGLASIIIEKRSKDAVVITLPADHLIKNEVEFKKILLEAAEFAYNKKGLVTIGIKPNRPETGYGYIQINEEIVEQNIHRVLTFAEKPNLSTAERFLQSGDFLWNSGMFIWRVDTILNELKMYLNELYLGLQEISAVLNTDDYDAVLPQIYGKLKSISIDYGIMEKSNNVFLIKANFDWNDVGSWEAVYELSAKDNFGNAITGEAYLESTSGSFVYNPKKFTAVIGLKDVIVIETEDALLVCNRKNAQEVKNVVDYLKMSNKTNLI